MTRSGALRGLVGTRIGGRYELVVELGDGDAYVRYEAVDVDGTRCLVAVAPAAEGDQLRTSSAATLESGTDDGLDCVYVVEPFAQHGDQPEVGQPLDAGPAGHHAAAGHDLIGTLFAGSYRILAYLGDGGMGTVFEAETAAGERVALKLMRPTAPNPHERRRFLREARTAAKLESKHVARVLSSGMSPDTSAQFIVMELLKGEDLAKRLKREGPLEPAVAARIVADACRGLADAHAAGLVHRDVKPANVFLHQEDTSVIVKLCDFGIVKEVALSQDETSLTRTGALVGSPSYMSPEQAKDSSVVDHRTDVWSAAATLYEALAGAPPWAGSKNVGEILLHLHAHDVPALQGAAPWVDAGLARVVHRGLARRLDDRYASAAEMAEALQAFASKSPIAAGDLRGLDPAIRARAGARVAAHRYGTTDVAAKPPPGARHVRRYALAGGLAAAMAIAGLTTWKMLATPPAVPAVDAVPECTLAACTAANGGKPSRCNRAGACVALENEMCAVLADEKARNDERTLWLGAMFPTDDPDPYMAELGRASRNAMELARRDFMSVSGGVPTRSTGSSARPIGIIACGDAKHPTLVGRHMVDAGVSAVVGFRTSKSVIDLAIQYFLPNDVLVIPALNSSALISTIPQRAEAPRLVYRTAVPTNDVMRALSGFLGDHLAAQSGAQREELRVALVRGQDAVGLALSESAFALLSFNGRSVAANGAHFREVAYDSEPEVAGRAVSSTIEHRPHVVIFQAQTEEVVGGFIEPLEASWRAARRPVYITPGTLDGQPFANLVARRGDLAGRLFGLTPLATTPANLKFTNHYNATFGEQLSPADAPGAPYDSLYLIAYGAYASGVENPKGSDIARGITKLLPPGVPIDVGPTSILKAFGELDRGGTIDLHGTYSRMDFDLKTGDSPADYSILCARALPTKAGIESVDSGLVYDADTGSLRGTMSCKGDR